MNKKYELIKETRTFKRNPRYRIRALKNFSDVKKGDLGGWVEGEHNLSQEGDCWVYDNGCVLGNGRVLGNGCVSDSGRVTGNGLVTDHGRVSGHGLVLGHGCVSGNGRVPHASILSDSQICTHTLFYDSEYFILKDDEKHPYKDCFLDPLNPSEEELIMFELEYGEPFPLELVKDIIKMEKQHE